MGVPYADPLWVSRGQSPYYQDKHVALRKKVRSFVDENILPYCEEWETSGSIPQEVITKFAENGLMAASVFPLATEYMDDIQLPGGISPLEWDEFCDLIVMDEIARCGCLGVIWGLACGNIIGLPPVIRFGTPDQKRKFIPDVLKGKTRFCLGVTEPDAGSDVAGITTTATRQGNKYVINGAKKWITNAIWADYCTAAVRTGGPGQKGISAIVIPLTSAGITRKRLFNSGVSSSGSTYIEFDNVEVPIENLIGEENQGFRIIMSNFNHERTWLSCMALRLARVCIEDSFIYASRRETFGKKLLSNQIIRAKLANLGRELEAGQAYLEQLVYILAQSLRTTGVEPTGIGGLLASSKVLSCRVLEHAVREAQQIMGGVGYSKGGRGGRVEQISRDVRCMVVGGGSEEILTELSLNQEMKALDSKL
uniref:Acyl-CoA dehydrogenase n=1 Tax=Bionectria ochroleuca TaxID=29856 RepID=A0A0B7K943_BIOOC